VRELYFGNIVDDELGLHKFLQPLPKRGQYDRQMPWTQATWKAKEAFIS